MAADDRPGGEEFAETAAEEFEVEAAEGDLVRFAVDHYTRHGHEGINNCLFALLCDVVGLYANRTRTPGYPRHLALIDSGSCDGGILQSVANNLAPERGFDGEN